MKKKRLNNPKADTSNADTLVVLVANEAHVPSQALDPTPILEIQEEGPLAVQSDPQPTFQISRIQRYWIATMLVFADCSTQDSPDGIFHVLARNFENTGALSWWLWRIGQGEMTGYLKGKDIVDAIRKIAHELYRYLTTEVGRPVARL